jgi:isoleucyl-tRNA synthetase
LAKVKALCDNLTDTENAGYISSIKNGFPVRLNGYDNEISADCFNVLLKDNENIVKSADGACIAINAEITPELKAEGVYREILRYCQVLRKEAGFAVSDRVTLAFETTSEAIKSVIESYGEDISRETLSEIQNISDPVMQKEIDLDDGKILILIK